MQTNRQHRKREAGYTLVAVMIGIAVALFVGSLAGGLNGFMIARGKIAPFIVTLGTMAIFRSLSLFIGNAGEIRSDSNLYGNFGMNSIFFLPVPVFVMLVLAAILSVVLNQTRYGRYLCAVGSNARVAAYSAVNVDRIKLLAYTLTGFVVGISAALLSSRFNAVSVSITETPNRIRQELASRLRCFSSRCDCWCVIERSISARHQSKMRGRRCLQPHEGTGQVPVGRMNDPRNGTSRLQLAQSPPGQHA